MKKFRFGIKTAALTAAASLLLSGCNAADIGKAINGNKDGNVTQSAHTSPNTQTSAATNAPDISVPDITAAPSVNLEDYDKGTLLTYDGIGGVNIDRIDIDDSGFSGDKGVWTVFVYMCGSDLESGQASATDDMVEMEEATANCPNLRFIIEADGTEEWQNNICKNNKKQRLIIENGFTDIIETGKSTNMGDPDTFRNFITWGIAKYPSEYMVLDFWNHGSGSINGVCFDETYDMDSLTLQEIDSVLSTAGLTRKFELIGFDACLMSTIEVANILVPYGKYMLASQNLESGYGWDYRGFSSGINGGAKSGDTLGKYLADAYYKGTIRTYEAADATQAVIDLSKIDEFIKAFNLYAKDAYDYGSDKLNQVIKAAKNALNFGGNNRTEGYTNMVDIKSLLEGSSFASGSAKKALDALDNCVVYSKNGSNNAGAGGLSLYYPLSVQGSRELDTFKGICISPYYLSLVDLCAYGSSTNGDTTYFDFDQLLNSFNSLWAGESLTGNYDYWNTEDDDSLSFDVKESSLEYEVEPHIDSEGYYTFKLTENSMYNLDTVYCNVMESFWDDEYGKEYMLDLGTDDYVDLDWDTGVCKDAFDGLWIALPDGQVLCAYLIDTIYDDTYSNIYTCPIYLNGEYTNLKIMQTYYEDETVTEALGTWTGVDESGAVARDVYPLQNGDVIEPCYPAYDAQTFEYECDYYGDPYIYNDHDTFGYDYLENSDYYYSFEIYDYFDNTLYTDFVLFGVEDGELYYYE